MSLPILISNRLIKLLGNISKTLCYPFHWIFPNMRFTIPEYSAPKTHPTDVHKIPKIIWQTNYTNNVSLPVYLNYLFNRLMSLDYEYRYTSTEGRLEYLKENSTPEIVAAYEQLINGASQADLWRLVVLYNEGGLYMDIDAHFIWPLNKIIEPEYEELFLATKDYVSNYFIAVQKGNKVLKDTIDLVVKNIQTENIGSGVFTMTGPGALNKAIGEKKINLKLYKYICVQGSFTNEHFQYIDKPRGKWTHAKKQDLLKSVQQRALAEEKANTQDS